MNFRSLHSRLILWYSGLVIIVSLAFGAYLYHGVRQRLYSEMEQTFTRRAHHVADNILTHLQDKQEIARQITAVYSPEANNRFIRILNKDGAVLYVSGSPKDKAFDPTQIALSSSRHQGQRLKMLTSGQSLLLVTTPVMASGTSYIIEMGMPTDELDTTLHGLVVTLLFGLPIVALIVSAGGYVLVQRSLESVENIRATAEQITFGNLSKRLPVVATGDALEHLSITLNQMLERLEDAYQQARRFSADASHELRTPLTIMRGELESLLSEKTALTDTIRERIGSVQEEVERLSRITESLFAISRLDAGAARVEYSTLNLTKLVESTTEQMALLAEEKAIAIAMQGKPHVWVKGDAARLKQVVVNLLDNAIKYTPHGGKIVIDVSGSEQKAVLTVSDNGIGIPTEALPLVFERFYRADKARSREQGGAGLGLSIVRSICLAHGGSVEIESVEGQGTLCRVELPAVHEKEASI